MRLWSPKKAILPIKVTTFDLWPNWLKDWPNRFGQAIAHLKALMVLQMKKFFDFWISFLIFRYTGRNFHPKRHRPKVYPHPLQPGLKQFYWVKNGPKRVGCWCYCYISRNKIGLKAQDTAKQIRLSGISYCHAVLLAWVYLSFNIILSPAYYWWILLFFLLMNFVENMRRL